MTGRRAVHKQQCDTNK